MIAARRYFHRGAAALLAALAIVAAWPSARADAPVGRYVTTPTTVMDTKTMLTWQRSLGTADGGTIGLLQDARAYCQAPWRLPEIKELSTLVDESKATPPLIDMTAFPDAVSVPLWSGTLSNTSPVDFRVFVLAPDGTTNLVYTNGSAFSGAYVRCVQP